HVNRILEPYGFHTVIVTGTHWRNFLALRCSRNAQPEAQDFGLAIAKAMQASASKELDTEGWHLPYVQEEDLREITDPETLAKISAGRCARVSYLTQDGRRSLDADITMCRRLLEGGHMSPFEHQARPRRFNEPSGVSGNLHPPWAQHRKLLPSENDFSRLISSSELTEGCRGDNSLAKFILSLTS
ncbi:MAG: hypothetical protein RI996_179, partial [Candidatus Parcubacteria bacterium]